MKWTDKELDILKMRYVHPLDVQAIATELNKTKPAIKLKAARLGLCNSRLLKDEEIAFLKEYGQKKSITQLSISMGRSWNTIRKVLSSINIQPFRPCYNKWFPSEIELNYIRNNHNDKLANIAKALNKSIPAINRVMKELGLMSPRVVKPKVEKVPRIKKEKVVKPVVVKAPEVPRDGINRIREAMERINKI